MAGGGGHKKRFQYCTGSSGQEILFLRAFQGHSGCNPIDPSLQDNVLTPNNFFECIYHYGCAINLHSITNSGLIPGGQNSSREIQTVFFTAVNPMDKQLYKQKVKRNQDSVAGSSKDTQRIQPKPKTQISSTVRPVCGQETTKEIEKRS